MTGHLRRFLDRCRASAKDERGSIAPAVPIIAMALLLLGGLTIDGSRQLNARGAAVAYAEEAARAGAQGVDVNAEDLELDPGVVEDRVARYCAEVLRSRSVERCQFTGITTVSDSDPRPIVVHTAVSTRIPSTLLGMVGVRSLSASATAKARPYEGIDRPGE